MRILIVEDNRHMRRALSEIMRLAYDRSVVFDAGDAATAFAVCEKQRPELVLMDVRLPDGNGIDLAARIKLMLPKTRVVVVSNNRSRVYQDAARNAGVAAYVTKDEVHEKLLAAVAEALSV